MAFSLSDYHSYFKNCQFRALFHRLTDYKVETKTTNDSIFGTPRGSFISKMTFQAFIKKSLLPKHLKRLFFGTTDPIAVP
jgi:hypothetical protein